VNGAAILDVKAPSSFLKRSFIPDMDIKGLLLSCDRRWGAE